MIMPFQGYGAFPSNDYINISPFPIKTHCNNATSIFSVSLPEHHHLPSQSENVNIGKVNKICFLQVQVVIERWVNAISVSMTVLMLWFSDMSALKSAWQQSKANLTAEMAPSVEMTLIMICMTDIFTSECTQSSHMKSPFHTNYVTDVFTIERTKSSHITPMLCDGSLH